MIEWKTLNDEGLLAPTMAKDFPNLPVVKSDGLFYFGVDGRKYLDFTSGIATENTGHRHPKVVAAIKEQVDHLLHGPIGIINYESILQLAKKMKAVLPDSLDCFFFGNSGAEAIEGAVKLARHVTKRPYVISFLGGFHGRTMGALSLTTSKSKYRRCLPVGANMSYQLPYANPAETPKGMNPEVYWSEQVENEFEKLFNHQVASEEVAAVILEPVLGEGGYVIPPQAWLQKIRDICDHHQILLIFDEVQTGFGRTGDWFAANRFGVTPDIMAIAKGIASGLPLSATVASKELMELWTIGSHSTTFGGNPVACAAACATIDVLTDEGLVENARVLGDYALDKLVDLKEKHSVIGSVRGIGLMLGIEIIDPLTGEPNGEGLMKILQKSLEKGVIFYLSGNKGEVIRMMPPLTIDQEHLDLGISLLDEAITEYELEFGIGGIR
ncbi:aspartate aminotransferase family protein [Metabacillus sediminilitoris]|uniref:(S)-3-amino-2-methylpropionate transaminase n=1 Tax=Metabacillus sediminilitoris TaxID=2567941 RepID=A0A4S4BL05_9BACI|nr:aspartate aminotransferase family protein [Metabacillus sediminilitoris]QGQ44046.1 aminotransferase class III-fold pyridoxal phosphate-dependent enzyme [Metabacillus sediminilitoris]THF75440.1 aminotransferase class III-fold pyridoxal phosphate-dependent enzyme [Metabacillus sediminilitoris]